MKITSIEKKSGTRYNVDVDGEYFYILDIEIIAKNNLSVGKEVTYEQLEDLKLQAEKRRARERAYYLLSYRDHSGKELYDKLCKNVSSQIAAQTVANMVEQGFVNDEQYAKKLAAYFLKTKCVGQKKAFFEMRKRGLDTALIQEALNECDVDPTEQITKLIDKKYYRYLGDYKGNQKGIAALLRQGFSYDDIKSAIERYNIEIEED